MEITEAIKTRKSIRGYKPDEVPRQILAQILEIATHAPSSMNTQPWEFTVITGLPLEMLKQANEEQFSAGVETHPDIPIGATTGPHRERQVALAIKLFQLLGISREDHEKRRDWYLKGHRFFDAPAVIIISIDESAVGTWSILDVGMVTQTIALAALEFGLGTCIQRAGVNYPDVVRKVIGIPESKQIVISVALGHPDWYYPPNKLETEREPLEKLATWIG